MIRSPEQRYADERHQSFVFAGDAHSPAALMVHGFTGTPSELYPLGLTLNQLGWSTACDLLPGFGRNIDKLAEVSHESWLQTVRDHWQTVQPTQQPSVLIGYSAGGAIATCIAAEFPPDYLILIAPFSRINHPLESLIPFAHYLKSDYLPYEDADFTDPDMREGLRKMVEDGVDIDDPAVHEVIRTSIKLPMAAVNQLRYVGQKAIKAAPLVRCPVLIIQGADDPVVTKDTTRAFVTQFGGMISYHEMPGDHHVAHQPKNSLELIVNFVRSGG